MIMKFSADIEIMPHTELLDPQGKTVSNNMKNLGLDGVEDVRIGKHIKMVFEAKNRQDAEEQVETACKKLLANVIMESYVYSIEAAATVE